MSEVKDHTGSSDNRNFTLLIQTAAFKPKSELSRQMTGRLLEDLPCSLCNLCCFRGIRDLEHEAGVVGCAVSVVGKNPLNIGSMPVGGAGEEGPSTEAWWICEALQRWGQLQRESM